MNRAANDGYCKAIWCAAQGIEGCNPHEIGIGWLERLFERRYDIRPPQLLLVDCRKENVNRSGAPM
jgi:hypothetical protein